MRRVIYNACTCAKTPGHELFFVEPGYVDDNGPVEYVVCCHCGGIWRREGYLVPGGMAFIPETTFSEVLVDG